MLKDDMELFDYNVQQRVNDFVAAAVAQVQSFAWLVFVASVSYLFALRTLIDVTRIVALFTSFVPIPISFYRQILRGQTM